MNFSETQFPLNSCPDRVRAQAPAPAQCLPAKRKPKLTNEGRDREDRKRTKKYSTIPASRRKSGKSESKTTCLYRHPTINMTTASTQGVPIEPRKPDSSYVPAHQAPISPAATLTNLLFPPYLLLPTATKTSSECTLPPFRRSSYERRHGGPHFTIHEDSTATSQFLFGSGYPLFPWDLDAPARARNGTDNTERDQENDSVRAEDIPTPRLPGRYAPQLVVSPTADAMVVQRWSRKANPQVSKQALDVLRMMR